MFIGFGNMMIVDDIIYSCFNGVVSIEVRVERVEGWVVGKEVEKV